AEWRDLESRSDSSFFIGWSWIGGWLQAIQGIVPLRLLRAKIGERTVGLCIVASKLEHRHLLVTSQTLRLHATGRPEFDCVYIECNGMLVDRTLESWIRPLMLGTLLQDDRSWDELVLDGISEPLASSVVKTPGLRQQTRVEANHYIDLRAVSAHPGGYLALLGSKTRSRIRQSTREYERLGELTTRAAGDMNEALSFFQGLKLLHQRYWTARGEPGAFSEPFFELFHTKLIKDAFARGEIQMLVIEAGSRCVGYLYNFVHQGRVYFYQSGFDYELCARYNQPGLVSLARAIELNASAGHLIFDLLAGDSQYKQRLGTCTTSMSWIVLQRDRLRFRAEDAARVLYSHLRGRGKPVAVAPPPGEQDGKREIASLPA
ncbi:MAG: GNAT family N-acetyltransferase, partial [Burkholderiaceae bacterium]